MKTRPITRKRFAELAGVTRQAIAAAARTTLRAALLGNDRIDVASECAQRYLRSHGRAYESGLVLNEHAPQIELGLDGEPTAAGEEVTLDVVDADDAIEAMPEDVRGLSIRDVVKLHGTESWARPCLDALKRIEEIREKRIKNDESSGRLIPREPVKAYVFASIDAVNKRLLGETPNAIAAGVDEMTRRGATLEERELFVRASISSHLKAVQLGALESLQGGPNDVGE